MWTISKTFHFSAAHHLLGLRQGHPCGRAHGHNYKVEVQLAARQLDGHCMVVDFGQLSPIKEWIDANLDHRDLNEIEAQPTCESLARMIFNVWWLEFPIVAVRVSESDSTWAEYRCVDREARDE